MDSLSSWHDDWPAPMGRGSGLAILLPGRNYPTTLPLLSFAGRAARQHGWQVRAVTWDAPELATSETVSWVGAQLGQAIGAHRGRVIVIAKSLGTCAASAAAEHGYDAVWLTPLLHLPEVVEAMARHPGRQLLIGGSDDPAWDRETALATGGDVVHLDGGDHGLFAEDAIRTAELHVEVTRAVDRWLRGTRSGAQG